MYNKLPDLPVSSMGREEPKRRRVQARDGSSYGGAKARRGRALTAKDSHRGRSGLRSATRAASFDSDDVVASLLDERWDGGDYGLQELQSTNKRVGSTQSPVLVKDPEGRDIGALLVAGLGPTDDKKTTAYTYRDTITDLLRRGRLYGVVDGVEKRIPFSEQHVYARGEVFTRCWIDQDKYYLRLKGIAWGLTKPIEFRVYTDKATMRNIEKVTWNGRHCSENAEKEFAGGISAAEAVTSNAAVSRVPVRAVAAAQDKKHKKGRPRRDTTTIGKRAAASSCANEIIVIDSDDDEDRDEEVLHPPVADGTDTAANETRAAVTAPLLRHGTVRVKQEPDPRSAASPKEVVLKGEDGTSLVAEFQRRAADFQQKIASFGNVDLGFVYEETMEKLLKEGRVYYAPANSNDGTVAKLFSRKAMPVSMVKRDFFEERSWKGPNQLELRLAERLDTAGNAVTPRIFINTAVGDQKEILSITWNAIHLTNESEILYT